MKKTIIGIALAFCLLLTACSVHAKSDTESITEAAAISSISDDHNKSPKRECNGYIVLETSLSLSKEDVTDKQFSDAEKILNLLDSKDKSMMNSLSIGKEKAGKTDLETFYAEICDVFSFEDSTYIVRSCSVISGTVLFDIWCYDGTNVNYAGDFTASEYKRVYPVKKEMPVIAAYTFSVRGFNYADAPVIAADVYTIENNMLEKCGTEAGKQFFWLYNEDEDKSRLFIFDEIKDGSCFAPDDIQNLALSGDIKQELAWDNGRLEVVSGYGKYVTDECSNNEKEIMEIFEKAYDLYLAADGISSEEYINIDGVFYLDGNEEDKTLDERIGEYSSSFTRRECERIFNGMREKDGTEYYVYSYGEKNGEAKDVLTSAKILENDLTDYDKVTLFSPVRGIDYSYAAGYAEIVEKSADSIEMKYTALYKGSDSTEENVVFADGKWSLEDGSDYILSDNDTVRSYEYHLLNEDGHWKFDDFVCYN